MRHKQMISSAFAVLFFTSGGCTCVPWGYVMAALSFPAGQALQSYQCSSCPLPDPRVVGLSFPGPGEWEKCCVARTGMNCHLEPTSQDPVPTFPLSCKTLGPAVQIQEVCPTNGSDMCCLALSSGSPKPWTKCLNHCFPPNLVKQVRILLGENPGILPALAVTETSGSFSS